MRPDFWSQSVEVFKRMGPPMRPHPSEIREMREWLIERTAEQRSGERPIAVLVLGVTAEIVAMNWPATVRITAIDRSEGMARAFWPGRIPGRRTLVRGDWDRLPFSVRSFDFVFGDGIFNTRSFPAGYLELGSALRSILRPGGCVFVRAFAQLEERERTEAILDAYRAGRIADYHALRFRFLTSLQRSAEDGVWGSKEYIDDELRDRGVALEELYRRTGYDPPAAPRRERAREDAPRMRISYPTVAELERVLSPGFRLLGRRHGSHPLAHRCPIFGLERVG